MLTINTDFLNKAVKEHEFTQLAPYAQLAHQQLISGEGVGNEFHGWVRLPETIDREEMEDIKQRAASIQEKFDAFVCIGIGGSYLGHKAIMEALQPALKKEQKTEILFTAHNLSSRYLDEVIKHLADKDYCINVIAKEGMALETAVTFRILRNELERRFGKEGAKERIIVTTDKFRGPLKDIVAEQDYPMYHLPHEVGGRFSVFTPVGLLPLAVAGINIDALIDGAKEMMTVCESNDAESNPALKYAMTRNIMTQKGKEIELFVSYEPYMAYFSEWLKQLFGESDGKDGKGLFPASALYSTDLHSLGQWVQEGRRNMFETVLSIGHNPVDVPVPALEEDLDNLGFLVGSSLNHIQSSIKQASMVAHSEGGVPNLEITIDKLDEYHMGAIMYFFMMSVSVGGYMAGVNPFDQNGVDQYKAEMMKILKS
ncbi:glucose-6-phosphate isomerase [Thaumasiovibrio sp. DFM-14]|uniref:glucose-6-phosphate isomerase n=1 Tax=Thaumasiovibrio sp. DFM-14 TaxID=3384792 RepID=UPI0039A10C22